jgi:hypothetical protein
MRLIYTEETDIHCTCARGSFMFESRIWTPELIHANQIIFQFGFHRIYTIMSASCS